MGLVRCVDVDVGLSLFFPFFFCPGRGQEVREVVLLLHF